MTIHLRVTQSMDLYRRVAVSVSYTNNCPLLLRHRWLASLMAGSCSTSMRLQAVSVDALRIVERMSAEGQCRRAQQLVTLHRTCLCSMGKIHVIVS